MGYVCLIGAMLGITGMYVFMKLFSGSVKNGLCVSLGFTVVFSIVATIACAIIGGGLPFNILESNLLALAFGVVTIGFSLLGIVVVRLGSMSMYSMFATLGAIVISFLYGIIFNGEGATTSVWRYIAIVIMVVSLVFPVIDDMKGKDKGEKGKGRLVFWLACFAGFLVNGMTGPIMTIQEGVQQSVGSINSIQFCGLYMLFTAGLALVILAVLLIIPKTRPQAMEVKQIVGLKPLLFSVGYGAVTCVGNSLNIEALSHGVPSSVQFPVVNGGVILVTALIGMFAFREKSGLLTKIGLVLTLIATVLFVL